MGQFEKGRTKTGGRTRGTKNKTTTDLKEWVFRLLNKNVKQIEQDLQCLDPRERVLLFEKLLRYVLPRQQAVTADVAMRLDENELEQFRAWQRRNARLDAMSDEELQAEIKRLDSIAEDI